MIPKVSTLDEDLDDAWDSDSQHFAQARLSSACLYIRDVLSNALYTSVWKVRRTGTSLNSKELKNVK